MTTRTWSGTSGNFTDAGNWTPTGVPASGDTAIINSGTVQISLSPGGVDIQLNEALGNTASSVIVLNNVTLDPSVSLIVDNSQSSLTAAAPAIDVSGASGFAGTEMFDGSAIQFNIPVNATLTNAGVLDFNGSSPETAGGGSLVNNSTIQLFNSLDLFPIPLFGDAITGTGTITLGQNARAEFAAPVAATQTLLLNGGGSGNEIVQLNQLGSFNASFDGYSTSDLIAVANIPFTNATYSNTGPDSGSLNILSNNVTVGSINFIGHYTLNSFSFTYTNFGGGNSNLQITTNVCFLAGTRIATPRGDVPIERISIGDSVLTYRGLARPVKWVGQGSVLTTRGRRNAATPVVVRKGALADNIPNRDLRLTKAHSLYVDDVLIPVEFLVNHRSVIWDDHAQEVTIYHIELETHDVLIADGAPAESYRDDGNRWLFRNANSGWHLPPQTPCAPVLTGGPVVDAVWARLLRRAGPRPCVPLTDEPDLHLLVDGRRVDAGQNDENCYLYRLTDEPDTIRIVSRSGVPQELGIARDPRPLGVAIRKISVRKGDLARSIGSDDAGLATGFHGFEPDIGIRWTNGDAEVPKALYQGLTGPFEVLVLTGGSTRYPADDRCRKAA